MPTMEEIYDRYSREYDELVDAEDYRGNLSRYLLSAVPWEGMNVLEAGTGTGRVTEIYAPRAGLITCMDRSSHMLEAARRRLRRYREKVRYVVADNEALPDLPIRHDAFIEGWSFGHSIASASLAVPQAAMALLTGVCRNLHADAPVVIIETMGTNTDGPVPPLDRLRLFYEYLETAHGFRREILRTDYRFPGIAEAARVTGFFFGSEMHDRVMEKGEPVVPEWTGVWIQSAGGIRRAAGGLQ